MHVLMAAARNPDERTSWLGQLLWLSDGGSGPDVPYLDLGAQPPVVRMEQRFREALGRVMIHRLNLPHQQPLVLFTDTREAMARFLVCRMFNLRIAVLHSGKVARKRSQITRIFLKLGAGPANARKFCRDLKITAADRDEALRWMEAVSLVSQGRDGWQLREGARLSFKDCTVPIIAG